MIDQQEEAKVDEVKINGNHGGGSGGAAPFSSLTTYYESHHFGRALARILLVLLIVGLVGAAGYGVWLLRGRGFQIPDLSNLTTSLTTLRERVRTLEGAVRSWSDDRDALYHRMAVLNSRVNRAVGLAHAQSQKMVQDLRAQLEAEMAKRDQVLNARLAEVETLQQAQNEKVVALQKSLEQTQQEIASLRGDTQHQLASLQGAQTQSQTQIDGITHQLARQRVDFEVAKNQTREVAPGISMRLTGTNMRRQRYSGWLYFQPDKQFVWIDGTDAQATIVLHSKAGGEPYQVVVTGVNRQSVAGYVLIPESSSTAAAATLPAEPAATTPGVPGS